MLTNVKEKWDKKYLLVIIGFGCLALAWYSLNKKEKDDNDLSFVEWLPALGGGAYALNFLFKLAK